MAARRYRSTQNANPFEEGSSPLLIFEDFRKGLATLSYACGRTSTRSIDSRFLQFFSQTTVSIFVAPGWGESKKSTKEVENLPKAWGGNVLKENTALRRIHNYRSYCLLFLRLSLPLFCNFFSSFSVKSFNSTHVFCPSLEKKWIEKEK